MAGPAGDLEFVAIGRRGSPSVRRQDEHPAVLRVRARRRSILDDRRNDLATAEDTPTDIQDAVGAGARGRPGSAAHIADSLAMEGQSTRDEVVVVVLRQQVDLDLACRQPTLGPNPAVGGAERLEVDGGGATISDNLGQGAVAVVGDRGGVVDADTDRALAAEALVRGGDGRQGSAEPAPLIEVLVVDRALRPENQPALRIAIIAPPHERAAAPKSLRRAIIPDIAVDHRDRLDGRPGTGATEHDASVDGVGHGLLRRRVREHLHRDALVAAQDEDAVQARVAQCGGVGWLHRVGSVEQDGEPARARFSGRSHGRARGGDLGRALLGQGDIFRSARPVIAIGRGHDDDIHRLVRSLRDGGLGEGFQGHGLIAASGWHHHRRLIGRRLRGRADPGEAEPREGQSGEAASGPSVPGRVCRVLSTHALEPSPRRARREA